MSSHQLDPRSMADAQSVSNFRTGEAPANYVRESAWVVWVQFAAVMLMLTGSVHMIQGFVALFNKEVYAVGSSGLTVSVGYTTWGWVHVIWGGLAILVGCCLLAGQWWARFVGVVIAFFSAIGHIAFLQASPVLSAVAIGIDIVIIWAIMIHGAELKKPKI